MHQEAVEAALPVARKPCHNFVEDEDCKELELRQEKAWPKRELSL